MRENREHLEVDLRRMIVVLWSNLWIILLVGALLAAMGFGYAWLTIEPTYSANTKLYVNNNYPDSPGYSSSQLVAAQDLADTYMVILRTHNVLDAVAEEVNLGYSYGQLRGMISASAVNETEVFQVTVTCNDYKHAAIIANAIAKVLPQKLPEIVDVASVRVVDYATENPNPVGPSYTRYAMMGFILGAMASAAIFVVAELMDTTINSEEYLAHVYKEYPLLAVVPGAESTKSGYKGYKGYYKGYYMEKKPEKTEKKPEQKAAPAKDNAKTGGAK